MEDFRSKLKNYKSKPNDIAWEKMLIQKYKRRIKKQKSILIGFILLNFIGLCLLALRYMSISSPLGSNTDTKEIIVDSNTIQEKVYSGKIKELEESNLAFTDEIKVLEKAIAELRLNLKEQKSKFINRPTKTVYIPSKQNQITYSKKIELDSTYRTSPIRSNILPNSNVITLNGIKTFPIEKHLLALFEFNKNPSPLRGQVFVSNTESRFFYFTLGTNYENNVKDSQRNFSLGLFRTLNKRLDIGLLLDFNQIEEKNSYLLNNDVKDHRLETIGLFVGRYKAINANKFMAYLDAGIGYRYGTISQRGSSVIDNQLQYFNSSVPFRGIAYQIAIGGMYDLKHNLSIGTRAYLDDNLHIGFNLNYKF